MSTTPEVLTPAPEFDLSTVPDAALWTEINRRRARLRKSYTGGVVWAKHNPATSRCRCAKCIKKRAKVTQ